jgi:hypothetical protein
LWLAFGALSAPTAVETPRFFAQRCLMGIMASKFSDTTNREALNTEALLPKILANGETINVEGTNVVRVPFGVRKAKRRRPERPEHWATLVLPIHSWDPTPPPQAA